MFFPILTISSSSNGEETFQCINYAYPPVKPTVDVRSNFGHVLISSFFLTGGWKWEFGEGVNKEKIILKVVLKGVVQISLGTLCVHDGEHCGCELVEVPNLCEECDRNLPRRLVA